MWTLPAVKAEVTTKTRTSGPGPKGVKAWIEPEGYRRFIAEKKRAFENQVDLEMGVKK